MCLRGIIILCPQPKTTIMLFMIPLRTKLRLCPSPNWGSALTWKRTYLCIYFTKHIIVSENLTPKRQYQVCKYLYIDLASKPWAQLIGSLSILQNDNRITRNCRNSEQRWKWRSTVNINAFKPPGSLEPSLLHELKGFTASTALNGCEHKLAVKLFSIIPN